MTPKLIEDLIIILMDRLQQAPDDSQAAHSYVQALGNCSKALGLRFGPFVGRAVPLVVARCDGGEDESSETREGALLALSHIVQFCAEVRAVETLCMILFAFEPRSPAAAAPATVSKLAREWVRAHLHPF
jgi:hypothetical protein